jgi:hypothetical protein
MEKGVNILHFLGGCTIDIAEGRAIAQTKMSISQRAPVEGEMCDVVCATLRISNKGLFETATVGFL